MAAAAATGVVGGITYTAVQKGDAGNLITIVVTKPDAATGAIVVADVGNVVTIKLAADGPTGVISSTISGVKAAVNTGVGGSRLVVASAGTDGNTGAVATGALAAGASGTNGYDDITAATTDGWALTSRTNASYGNGDVLEKVDRRKGGLIRVSAAGITGATNVARAAYNEELRRAKMGFPRSLMGISGAGAYLYTDTP